MLEANQKKLSKEILDCFASKGTLIKAESALSKELKENLNKLSASEVTIYLDYLNKGGFSSTTKYYQFTYEMSNNILRNQKIDTEKVSQFIKALSEHEKWAFNNFQSLPNKTVREVIFPVDDFSVEMFRTMMIGFKLNIEIQDSCKQYIKT